MIKMKTFELESIGFYTLSNEIAVMFLKDDMYFWTHITPKEFELLYNSMKGENDE